MTDATRGLVGIPRVLNMYENYPFWFTFLHKIESTGLFFLPHVHPRSFMNRELNPSPVSPSVIRLNLAHGHVKWLICSTDIPFIFYPCVPYERSEFKDANNHYNCPIVTSYAENIKNNMDDTDIRTSTIIRNPFLCLCKARKLMTSRLVEEFSGEKGHDCQQLRSLTAAQSCMGRAPSGKTVMICAERAKKPLNGWKNTMHRGIVLAGRPYHIDP